MMKVLPLALALFLFAGCAETYNFAPVSGTVTLDGQPLSGALVSFEPLKTGESTEVGYGSYAECDVEGRFKLKSLQGEEGAIIGPHRVFITTFKGDLGSKGETIIKSKEKVPAKYSDYDKPLKFDVPKEGTDQANFDLNTK